MIDNDKMIAKHSFILFQGKYHMCAGVTKAAALVRGTNAGKKMAKQCNGPAREGKFVTVAGMR